MTFGLCAREVGLFLLPSHITFGMETGKRRMNALKTGILMGLLFALFMGVGAMFGGKNGLVLAFFLALATNFFAYWFSDKIALMMGGAQEVSEAEAPQLYRTVGRLAANAGLPMPRVYIIPSPQPNAFATGRDPNHSAVAVTEGLLQMLSQDELEGVIAHELAHIKHRDILISSIAATIAGAIGFIAQMLQWGAIFGTARDEDGEHVNPFAAMIAAMFIGLAATLIQLAISRAREYEADRGGAEICGRPLSLANALRKIEYAAERIPMSVNPAASHMYIVNPLGGDLLRGVMNMMRTHPETADRIRRLEQMAYRMGIAV